MSTATLPKIQAEVRDRTGSRYAARVRTEGKLPAVIYGHKQDPIHVAVDSKELVDLLHHNAQLIEVDVNGKADTCLVKDIQWDYLGTTIIHVDLARVDLSEEVAVEVQIELIGDAVGLIQPGTLLDLNSNTIEVKCRADAIPEKLVHDVTAMDIGDSLLASGLTLPSGVTLSSDADTLIAHLSMTKVTEEEEDADAEDTTDEPEIVGGKPGDEKAAEGDEK
jgi:large subunit ribosomal protein L25